METRARRGISNVVDAKSLIRDRVGDVPVGGDAPREMSRREARSFLLVELGVGQIGCERGQHGRKQIECENGEE